MKKTLSILFLACALNLMAQQQVINVGTVPNDHTGDPARIAGQKINANFTQLFNAGLPASIFETNAVLINAGTNFFTVNAALAAAAGWPTNAATLATLAQLTTAMQGITNYVNFTITNGTTIYNLRNATNYAMTNLNGLGFLVQWSQQPTNAFIGTNQFFTTLAQTNAQIISLATNIASGVTNTPVITRLGTNVGTSLTVGGSGSIITSISNSTGIAWQIAVGSQTNGFSSIVFSNPSAFLTPAQLFSSTNGFIGTNALVGYATLAYANMAAQNATNGLPTRIWTLGTASQSNATDFVTQPQLTTATNSAYLSATNYALFAAATASNGAVAAAVVLKTAATNGLPPSIWTLGTASQSNATAFYLNLNLSNYQSGAQMTAAINAATNGLASTNQLTSATNSVSTNLTTLVQSLAAIGTNNLNNASNAIIAFQTNYFVRLNGGIATNLQIIGNLRFGNWTNFNQTTNLVGSHGANVVQCNSTWEYISANALTNVFYTNWGIQASGGNFYMQSNGVSFYQNTTLEGQWTIVAPFGSLPAPYSSYGSYWNMNGVKMIGGLYSTSLVAQVAAALASNTNGGIGTTNFILTGDIVGYTTNNALSAQGSNFVYVVALGAAIAAGGPTNGITASVATNIAAYQVQIASNAITAGGLSGNVSTNRFLVAGVSPQDGIRITNLTFIKTMTSPDSSVTFTFTRNADGSTNAALVATGGSGGANTNFGNGTNTLYRFTGGTNYIDVPEGIFVHSTNGYATNQTIETLNASIYRGLTNSSVTITTIAATVFGGPTRDGPSISIIAANGQVETNSGGNVNIQAGSTGPLGGGFHGIYGNAGNITMQAGFGGSNSLGSLFFYPGYTDLFGPGTNNVGTNYFGRDYGSGLVTKNYFIGTNYFTGSMLADSLYGNNLSAGDVSSQGNIEGQSYTQNGNPLVFQTNTILALFCTNAVGSQAYLNGIYYTNGAGPWTNVTGGFIIPIGVGHPSSIMGTNTFGQQFYSHAGNSLLGYWSVIPFLGNTTPTNQPLVSVYAFTNANGTYLLSGTGGQRDGSPLTNVNISGTTQTNVTLTNSTAIGTIVATSIYANLINSTNLSGTNINSGLATLGLSLVANGTGGIIYSNITSSTPANVVNTFTATNTIIAPTFNSFALTGAGNSSVNVNWVFAGTTNLGISQPNFYYTNSANSFLLVSNLVNTGASKYGITNGTSLYYTKRFPIYGGNFLWVTEAGGTAPPPITIGVPSPYAYLASTNIPINPGTTNSVTIGVEVWGNDLIGQIGSVPFASISGTRVNLNTPLGGAYTNGVTFKFGSGTFTNTSIAAPNTLGYSIIYPNDHIVGNGRGDTILSGVSGGQYLGGATEPTGPQVLDLGLYNSLGFTGSYSNYVANLTCGLIQVSGSSVTSSNLYVENCIIGSYSGIDCLYGSASSIDNVYTKNSTLISSWDTEQGLKNRIYENCYFDYNDIYAKTNSHVGMHGFNFFPLTGSLTIIGGTANMVENYPTNYFPQYGNGYTNALFYLPTAALSNLKIRVYGLNFNYTNLVGASNAISLFYNPNNYTDISGYMWVNGVYTTISNGIATASIAPNGTFTGNGTALTNLNASAFTSGTLPVAQLPAFTGAITNSAGSSVTWLGSFTSSQLIGAVSDETGSGSLVFGTSPTLTTANINGLTNADLIAGQFMIADANKRLTSTLNANGLTNYPGIADTSTTRTISRFAGDNVKIVIDRTAGETFYDSAGNANTVINPSGLTLNNGIFTGNGTGLTNISIGTITPTNVGLSTVIRSTNGAGVAGGLMIGYAFYTDTNLAMTITDTNAGTSGGGTNPLVSFFAPTTGIHGTNLDFQGFPLQTNFISGKLYTNNYGVPIQVTANAALTVAAIVGAAGLALESPGAAGTGSTNYSAISTLITSIAMNYTNMLSMIIPTNAQYSFTNKSSGVGNSATVVGGQIMPY